MRALLKLTAMVAVVCIVNTLCLTIFVSSLRPTLAQDDTACVPGDLTGDDFADITDVIRLLDYLFKDGDAPEVCAQTTEIEVPVQVWPPKPEDLVHVHLSVNLNASTPDADIYEVPDDKYLVVTDVVRNKSTANPVALIQVDGTDTKELIPPPFWVALTLDPVFTRYSSAAGFVVEPGTTLAMERTSSGITTANVMVTGYLVDAEEG